MANIRTVQQSFNGGILTPESFGKFGDAKYGQGLADCCNFVIKPHGPIENRPGFEFVREVKDSSKAVRLLPFSYSTTQTIVIEMGEGYFRFHANGATVMSGAVPYEIANPYDEADLFDIHYVQSADVITLVHPNYPPMELRRLGATNWTLVSVLFIPTIDPPSTVTVTPSTGIVVNITAISNAAAAGISTTTAHNLLVGDSVYISGCQGMALPDGFYVVRSRPDGDSITIKTVDGGVGVDTTSLGVYTGGGKIQKATKVSDYINYYKVVAVGADGITESVPSEAASVGNNLYVTGAFNTITWSAVPGAVRYDVYKRQSGIYGYIGQAEGTSFADDNIAPDLGKTPQIYDDVFGQPGDYPGAVSYFEQRRCFAGTKNRPQHIWMTRSGTESTMSYSLPIKDADRISFRIAGEANTIRHIVPLSQLLLLTSSAERRVSSVNSDDITPTSISIKPQSYIGSSNVQPTIINNAALYCAERGGHVYEIGYSWQANGFQTGNLSIRAPHLFDGKTIRDLAYSKAPSPVVWFVSSSGELLGLTYVPEHQVGAWHRHTTDGVFESCASVAEGNDDSLYVVVKRNINGQDVRYIERMVPRRFETLADAFFVDSGLTYSGAPISTVSGLSHLEGKSVAILCDGAVHQNRVVEGGAITLDAPASKIHVGLPIQADAVTLPMAFQVDNAFGQGRFKNVTKVWVRVYRSSGVFAGSSADRMTEYKQRKTEAMGTPPEMRSDILEIVVPSGWTDDGQIHLRQTYPLPLTIASLSAEVALGG